MSLFLLLIILYSIKLVDSGFLLCDNNISNKVSLIPFNCSNQLVRDAITPVKELTIAVLSKRPFSLDGYGLKCSGYYTRYELTDDYSIEIQTERIQLNINDQACRIMAASRTYTTEYGRKINLDCDSYAAMCVFNDERGPSFNGSYIQIRYHLMVIRIRLKSNSAGLVTDNGAKISENCQINDRHYCQFYDSIYVWDSSIIHDEDYILLEHDNYLFEKNYAFSKNKTITNPRLFFINGKYIFEGVEYLNTTSGLHLMQLDKSQNLLYFGVLLDDLALRLDRAYSKITEIEMEKLAEASTAFKLMETLKKSENQLDKQQYEQTCTLYKNQFNVMISLPNNYYPLTLLNGTNVYLFVTNGNIYLTSCESLLSVSESSNSPLKGCFKYKPVTVHDRKFKQLQGYMLNQMYINIHPDKIPCY